MKIGFIGGGTMAEVMVSAILNRRLTSAQEISVSDIDWARRGHLEKKYSVAVMSDNRLAASGADVVILAIKPQNIDEVMANLGGQLAPGQLVLSIVAGKRISTLSARLKHGCIVRSMPNTPAQIGEGISVWTATPQVTGQQREWAGSILGAMGTEIYVADEGCIDMATAVSGSGPAYVFLFVESLTAAAVHIGLPSSMAEKLVLQTLIGSGHLIQKSGKTPAELRKMVTSPGGTTAEAIAQFEKGGFSDLITRAVSAAYEKSKKLGG